MLSDQRFWKRFRQNKTALLSGLFISLLVVMAIFAYPLSPDDSEDANTMIVEIAAQSPGYHCMFYRVGSKDSFQRKGFSYLFNGHQSGDHIIPIEWAKVVGDQVMLLHLLDADQRDTLVYPLPHEAGITVQQKESYVKEHCFQRRFWLGTDRSGRDLLSRLLLGSRVTLAVGIIAVILSILIGVWLGALAGYYGGKVDQLISWFIQVIWAVPTILLVFAISLVLGKGFWQIFIAIGCTMWVGTARMIRGQVMSIRELDYIQAAKVMGFSSSRIIFKHILPNVMSQVVVMAASNFAAAILIEAGLSFLGIGIQPPTPSWGYMIKENYNFIITQRPFLAIIPGVAIMLTVLAFNLLGNALRDALDVKSKV